MSLPRYTDLERDPLPAYADGEDIEYTYSFEKPLPPKEAPAYEQAFEVETPSYNDVFFSWVFAATLAGFIWMVYNSRTTGLKSYADASDADILKLNKSTKALLELISVSTIIPFVSSLASLFLAYQFPMLFIYLGFSLGPMMTMAISFTSFITGDFLTGILMALMSFLLIKFMLNSYNMFAYSSMLLKLIMQAVYQYPSTIIVSVLSSVVTCLVGVAYIAGFALIMQQRQALDDSTCPHSSGNDICVSNKTTLTFFYCLFTGYYLMEVLKNVNHATLSGIFGTWYFFGSKPNLVTKPKNAAWGSFKRSVTYCFGSICLGSLIVSAISTLQTMLSVLRQRMQDLANDDDSNPGNDIIICALICFVRILEWFFQEVEYWMKWFNRFAYSYMALYGKSYLVSARDTFEIMKYKGVDILITDSLIGSSTTIYCIISLILTGMGMFLSYKIGHLEYISQEMLALGAISGLLISWFITKTMLNVADVGVCTIIIGLAISPDEFIEGREDYWSEMVKFHPDIQNRVKVSWPESAV